MVTYAVVDARTGTMISSHPSLGAARADAERTTAPAPDRRDSVAIYVFDDTGHVAGECAGTD
ncbi:MAG: hypothetical protein QOJ07_309 [Thermoleophilaceae bacterium]|nr:hypothetical protein [Thermoleophilaceae bacterium]